MSQSRLSAVLLVVAGLMSACKGESRLKVWIHDEPFRLSGRTVEHLNIQVARIEVHSAEGAWLTLSEELRTLDILAIAASDPVLLSDTSVPAGAYTQIRLVLTPEGNTIVVDGETHPLEIPSSEQTGVKIVRPFVLPEGRLFELVLDFRAEESVILNAKGYQLKPVIRLSEDEEERVQLVYGCFSGFLPLEDVCSEDPATFDGVRIDLTEDGHFSGQATIDSRATLSGDYFYNSETRVLEFSNITLEHEAVSSCEWYDIVCHLTRAAIADLEIPTMRIGLQNWSDDKIRPRMCGHNHVIDRQGPPGSCGLPPIPPAATLTVNVTHLDPTWGADYVLVAEVRRADGAATADIASAPRNGLASQSLVVSIPHTRFAGSAAAEMRVRAVVGKRDAAGTGARLSLVTRTLTGTFVARSEKPHHPAPTITLSPGGSGSIDVPFPPRMTISVTPPDFSTPPTFFWTPIPGISRYLITISIPDQEPTDGEGTGAGPASRPQGDGNSAWDFLMSEVVGGTSYTYVPAGYLLHTDLPDVPTEEGALASGLLPFGTPIRVEVIAILPGAASLSAQSGTGVHSTYAQTFTLGGP